MADSMIRVRVPIDAHDPKALAEALVYASKIHERGVGTTAEIILLTHGRNQLGLMPVSEAIGAPGAKALEKGESVSLPTGGLVRAETLQTLRFSARGAVIVAYFADDSMMTKVDGYSNVAGVVAVPAYADSLEAWTERWAPRVPGQAPASPAALIDDPRVEKAMESLTRLINLGSSVLHPSDKKTAEDVLKILRAKNHRADAAKLKSWAIRNGWQPKAAAELEKLAARIFALKSKPSLVGIHDPEGRYERWV